MSTELRSVLDEVIMMSGNSFIGDLDAVGFSTKDFITLVRISLDRWSEYRSISRTVKATVGTSLDMSTVVPVIPRTVKRVTVNNYPVSFSYANGILRVARSGLATIEYVPKVETLLTLKLPSLDDTDIDNWVLDFDRTSNRFTELTEYITGMFMVALGRACRRFTIQEMPIGLDSEALISDGSQIIDRLTTQMQETSDSYDNMLSMPQSSMMNSRILNWR